MILGVYHAAIAANDIDAALVFCYETLGFEDVLEANVLEAKVTRGLAAVDGVMGFNFGVRGS